MYDCNSYDDPLTIDPGGIESIHFDNGYLSPNSHGEMCSPGAVSGMYINALFLKCNLLFFFFLI